MKTFTLLALLSSLVSTPVFALVSNTTVQTVTANGTGATTDYTIGFDFRDNSQVVVSLVDTTTTPTVTTNIVQGAGAGKFTVINGNPGTKVRMGTAPTTTQHLVISRSIPLTQTVHYDPASAFPASDHETQMDYMVMIAQGIQNQINNYLGSGLSGDVTTSAGSSVTSVSSIAGNPVSGTTGTGNVVFSASPTFTGTNTMGNATIGGNILTTGNGYFAMPNTQTGPSATSSNANGSIAFGGSGPGNTVDLQTGNGSGGWATRMRFGAGAAVQGSSSITVYEPTTFNSTISAGTITAGTWNGTRISQAYGGTNIDTSASTGVPQISTGTWSVSNTLPSTVQGNITQTGTVTSGTWNGTSVDATHGGTAQSTWTLGDTLYSSASNTLSKLAGNTTSTKKYLSQTGTGSVSAAPAWAQVAFSDLSGSVAASQMPALTGDVTTSAGAVASTVAAIAGTTVSGTTGTGNVVFAANPQFTNNIGIGAAATASTAVNLSDSLISGINQTGFSGQTTFNGTNSDINILSAPTIAASVAATTVTGIQIQDATKNSGATIATDTGLNITAITGGTTNYAIKTSTGQVNIGDSTDSSSSTTGSLITAGGVGIAKSLKVGTSATITGTTTVTGGIVGVTTVSNATAGNVGEYISASVSNGSPTSLTNNVTTNLTSIPLTAGDWDVSAIIGFTGTPTGTAISGGISTSSAAFQSFGDQAFQMPTMPNGSADVINSIPSVKINVSSTTTTYLIARCVFSASTCSAYGRISARRVR